MDEFVVRGGLVYDGTGAPPAQADVWVREGEIMDGASAKKVAYHSRDICELVSI